MRGDGKMGKGKEELEGEEKGWGREEVRGRSRRMKEEERKGKVSLNYFLLPWNSHSSC